MVGSGKYNQTRFVLLLCTGGSYMENFSDKAKKAAETVGKHGKSAMENTQRIAKNIGEKSASAASKTKENIESILHKEKKSHEGSEAHIKGKKDMKFKSLDSLQSVVNVVNDAAAALNDSSRTIKDSAIPEVLAGALGAGVGGVGSFAALYGLGTVGLSAAGITSGLAAAGAIVGGGMVAGVFVLAAPVAILAGTSVGVATRMRNKQLRQEKERLYQEVIKKHEAIIRALKEEVDASQERIDYLQSLSILLKRALIDLGYDLGEV